MKQIKTTEAVGHVLCHDITQIIPGEKKGPVFKKGHIVTEQDIPVLLSVGKENLFVWEKKEGILHEDEAAEVLKEICIGKNEGFVCSQPSEGKISISAGTDGLLKINTEKLNAVNALGEMMIATVHGNFPVKKGDALAATRIIPLVIEEEKMNRAKKTAGDAPLLEILPIQSKKTAVITTGSEVYKGLIKDAFGPVLKAKLAEYGSEVIAQKILPDDKKGITDAILEFAANGAELILVTGGMSVDPDDQTPGAIKDSGAQIVTYGAPVLPGAMMLVSYLEREGRTIPVLGLPGCVMYAKRTVFDLLLPRVLADEKLTGQDISVLGEGGLCLGCKNCTFPHCGFGK
ncbi:MAG: molybdopterin-binding protein [Treponema sp.]|nr:molybdopterin-binding protein [Treponema sp.]